MTLLTEERSPRVPKLHSHWLQGSSTLSGIKDLIDGILIEKILDDEEICNFEKFYGYICNFPLFQYCLDLIHCGHIVVAL